jgi:hypothetical protein
MPFLKILPFCRVGILIAGFDVDLILTKQTTGDLHGILKHHDYRNSLRTG